MIEWKRITLLSLFAAAISLMAAEGEIREVTAEGRGANRQEAIDAAYRNAIAQQVGVIVKERTELNNDKVKSQILTLSNGFIAEVPPDSSILETKVDGGVHVTIKGLKVYVEKMRKRMLSIYTATLPLSDIQKAPEKFGYQKFSEAYTRMLIDEIDDYVKIIQIQPVNKILASNRRGNPILVVNYLLVINPADYQNYIASLYANLLRMNFVALKPTPRQEKGNFFVSYNPIPTSRKPLSLATNMLNIDKELLRTHYINNQRKRRQLICKMELLDQKGEVLQGKIISLLNRQFPIFYSDRSLNLTLPDRQSLKQELHTAFEFTNPENATKVSSIRLSLHYDFPGDDVQRDFGNWGFFEQK